MKSIYTYALLGALLAVGAANAATTTTIPVGYTTTNLVQGFNLVGLTLQSPLVASDTVKSVTATSVEATSANFASLTAGAVYILEITSGTTTTGLTVEVTVADATHLTTVDNLVTAGVAAGTTYQLRKAPTLEETFGTTATVLAKANTEPGADVVWVPTATPGSYTRYFVNNAGAWRNAAGGAAANVPLVYLDGIFIQRKAATALPLTLTGEVKKVSTKESLVQGFNLVSTVYPVGTTLQNSGLDATLTKANTEPGADVVWVPTATPGSYTRYFVNNAGAWRNAAGGAPAADLPLTSAVFVQKKVGTGTITLTPPAAYASL